MFEPIEPERYNIYELNRQLDITKSRVFMGKNSAFLSSLMCSMPMIWTKQVQTAATNGEYIWWNPDDFLRSTQIERDTTVLHEIWHKALLHPLMGKDWDPAGRNIAFDLKINNGLDNEGYNLAAQPFPWFLDHQYDGWAELDIYEHYMANNNVPISLGMGPGGAGDFITDQSKGDFHIPPPNEAQIVADVQQAIIESELAGQWGEGGLGQGIKTNLQQFLHPVVPWHLYLTRWLRQKLHSRSTYARPSRRSQEAYLPSRFLDKGGLDHLAFFADVSGSVSDTDAIRIASEIRFIWNKYKPKMMTVIQFDDKITHVHTMHRGERFDEFNIVGRGGTDLRPVRQWIIDNKPTAAVIFSDLICYPMEALPAENMIPMLWVAVGNKSATIPHGEMVYIKG